MCVSTTACRCSTPPTCTRTDWPNKSSARVGVACQLTGKIRRGQPAKPLTRAHDIAGTGPHFEEERLFRIVEALEVVAGQTGKSIPQIALNWLLGKKTVSSVIIGARDEKPLIENIGATGWSLTPEQNGLLEQGSDAPPAYPTWHQRGFAMLNEE